MGTAGARIMVSKQILASGGMWLEMDGTEMLIDPGPGALVQAAKRKLDPTRLSAIVLSHKHLDHSGDVNAMIEAMTEGGTRRRGQVFCPGDALDEDPVVFRYLCNFPEKINILEEGGKYRIDGIALETPLRHRHGVETYGIVFRSAKHTMSYIPDSLYFEELGKRYQGDLIVINVVRFQPGGPFQHLSLEDAARIIAQIRPKVAILTHFGMTMWRAHPWEQAERLSQETGVRVIAARDGMQFDFSQLDSVM